MAPVDPHSFVDSEHPFTNHVNLSLYFNFDSRTIDGSAVLTLEKSYTGDLYLDTGSLSIHGVHSGSSTSNPICFSMENPHPIKGTLLRIALADQICFTVTFTTHRSAQALHWLNPAQTAGKKFPYVYTQCHPIFARTIFPCQDTPRARIRYRALLNIPHEMSAVMSASHVGTNAPLHGEAKGACPDHKWVAQGRIVEHFLMEQSIPPYLFAFAVGNIDCREIGPRTKVYSEPTPALDAAAREFMDAEEIIQLGEKLFGRYEWERFDLLVLPPSFVNGGMEHPRMVFLSPTLVVGDSSGASVVAHELAHSWTGNLVTHATCNDHWLNEGFTTYAERRIIEVLQGEERAALIIALGWCDLKGVVERFKDNIELTKLRTNLKGVDPDYAFSEVAYEKGYQFIYRLERQVGRSMFDEFLSKYIQNFKFQSIDTDTFLVFLKKNLPGIEREVDLDIWIEGTGIPLDAIEPISTIRNKVLSLSTDFMTIGRMPSYNETTNWQGLEWRLYLENLPKKLHTSQIIALDEQFQFSNSSDWEVKVAFFMIVAFSGYKPYFKAIESNLHEVGRLRFLRHLYTCLLQGTSSGNGGRELAKQVYEKAKNSYHPIAQGVIESLLAKYT